MSDRTRTPEEIEESIDRRQEDLAEDLEALEYRLSRKGMKEEARDRVSTATHGALDRAADWGDKAGSRARELGAEAEGRARELSVKAGERAREFRDQASEQMDQLRHEAAHRANENRPVIAGIAASLAIMLGIYAARRRNRMRRHREDRWEQERYASSYDYAMPAPTRAFQYSDFGDY